MNSYNAHVIFRLASIALGLAAFYLVVSPLYVETAHTLATLADAINTMGTR